MSQYSWFFVNKNYLLFAILASVIAIPVGYVGAAMVFDLIPADQETDGAGGFTLINGTTGVATWTNSTTDRIYAIVAGMDDDSVTVIDVSTPTNISASTTLTHQKIADSNEYPYLDGVHDVEVFSNTNGTFAVTVSNVSDSIQVLDLSNPDVAIYTSSNYTAAGISYTDGKGMLDGAYDVAIFNNITNNRQGPMAIVASFVDDGVQILDLRSFNGTETTVSDADTWALNQLHLGLNATADGSHGHGDGSTKPGPRLVMDGASGVDTWEINGIAYAIVTASVDDGFQVLSLVNTANATGAAEAAGISIGAGDGFLNPPFNSTGMSPYSNATDTAAAAGKHDCTTCTGGGYKLLNGAMDVATWNVTAALHYAAIVSNVDDALIIIDLKDPTFSTGGIGAAQLSNRTATDGGFGGLDGANNVDVLKIDDRHYGLITSNSTANTGVMMVDLYNPLNPQVVDANVYLDVNANSGKQFTELAGARDVASFYSAPYHYAIVVVGESSWGAGISSGSDVEDAGISIIRLNDDRSTSSGGLICGVSKDCEAPSISKHGSTPTEDGFSINGKNLANQARYNDVDTTDAKVGQLVTIKARIADDWSLGSVVKSILYFDQTGTPNWSDADAAIKYHPKSDTVESIDNNDIFDGDASSAITINPYGDDSALKLLDVTFKIMFTQPMETSHIGIQTIDEDGNYQLLYFRDALTVTGQATDPTQTIGEDAIEGEVTQTVAVVPEWVKNTASWWAEDKISEVEFVKGVEYLIKEQIIDTNAQTTNSVGTGAAVPEWVKNTAGWWADGQISENEFVNAIEHLVKTGTIIII